MSTEPTPIVSRALPDGTLLETIYDPDAGTTALAIGAPNQTPEIAPHFDLSEGGRLVPYSPTNNLFTTGCVLLPSGLGELGDKGDLVEDIRAYLARYVDLSPAFRDIAPYYVLLTWVHDRFREMPALRFRGDYGTGKTRALLTVGSLCYKPFFASGASTVSPIFHILDAFRGTLVLDEADFRFSDATSELVKILNNGTVDGLPVLRTMTNRHRELNPQAFRVFGPKILAMRESFADPALESRFLTEETGGRPLPSHIPIHTPESLRTEAIALRNRLLVWRLHNWRRITPDAAVRVDGAGARLNQMAHALLSLVDDEDARARIAAFLTGEGERQQQERRETPEAKVLAALIEAFEQSATPNVAISAVAHIFNGKTLEKTHLPMTSKWVGSIIRTRLRVPTRKSHGVYVVPHSERERIYALAARFGLPPISAVDDASNSDTTAGAAVSRASTEPG